MLISAKCCIVSLSRGWVWMFQFSAASFVLHLHFYRLIRGLKSKKQKQKKKDTYDLKLNNAQH